MKNKTIARLLLVADGISAFGTWVDMLAILTLSAYKFHVSPYQMALVAAAGLIPGILAAPYVGRWCDQGNPKALLLGSIFIRMLATAGILLCSGFPLLLALIALRSLMASFAPPAINVMAVRAISPDDLNAFYSTLNVLNNCAKVLAPALGTVASSLTSETTTLAVSMGFAAISAIVFSMIRVNKVETKTAASEVGKQVKFELRTMRPLLFVSVTYFAFVFLVNNHLPLMLQRDGFDKSLLGILVSCSGAGNILSGLWITRLSKRGSFEVTLPLLLRAAAGVAVGFMLFGVALAYRISATPVILSMLFFIVGTFSARYAISSSIYLAKSCAENIGQGSSIIQAIQNTAILLAPLAGAYILTSNEPYFLFMTASVGGLIALGCVWLTLGTGMKPRVVHADS